MLKRMRKLLLPLSWVYSGITFLRNYLYDKGLIHSVAFDVPVVCVGNITVGGTGKTPCIEYLIRLLMQDGSPGLVSRGYRRKTKGLVMANDSSDALTIGDEPFQIKRRFPQLPVVVSGDRAKGISHLLNHSTADVVLMDDGFQHRPVRAGLYIMMVDYNRPLWDDHPFPAGFLREGASGRYRAHVVVVNKCPDRVAVEEREFITRKLALHPHQSLFFTRIRYGELVPFLHSQPFPVCAETIIAVSGIANPDPFHSYLYNLGGKIVTLPFGDHHHFGDGDLKAIEKCFLEVDGHNKVVVMTEKDASRLNDSMLRGFTFPSQLFYLPIELEFLFDGKSKFDQLIKHYVGKNQ